MLLETPHLSSEEKEGLRKVLEDKLLHEQELAEEEETFKDILETQY